MNLRPNYKEEIVEVNLTPLIDIVFLLLIFFMVSTTFEHQAKLKITLPEATAKALKKDIKSLVISIDAKGNYFVNDKQVVNQKIETLKQAVRKSMGNNKDISLLLRADAKTAHRSVVRAMDAASQLGLTKLSIATTDK